MRIRRMTIGSTYAVDFWLSSVSRKARTKEMPAASKSIITSWSLNCSRMSSHRGVEGSSGISVHATDFCQVPCLAYNKRGRTIQAVFRLSLWDSRRLESNCWVNRELLECLACRQCPSSVHVCLSVSNSSLVIRLKMDFLFGC